jgi:hypothetical protein
VVGQFAVALAEVVDSVVARAIARSELGLGVPLAATRKVTISGRRLSVLTATKLAGVPNVIVVPSLGDVMVTLPAGATAVVHVNGATTPPTLTFTVVDVFGVDAVVRRTPNPSAGKRVAVGAQFALFPSTNTSPPLSAEIGVALLIPETKTMVDWHNALVGWFVLDVMVNGSGLVSCASVVQLKLAVTPPTLTVDVVVVLKLLDVVWRTSS